MKYPLFVAALLSAISSVSADTIVLKADIWCPYNCESQKKPGIIVEIAREVFSEAGHQVQWEPTPYSRALAQVKIAEANGVPGAYKSDAPDFVFSDDPVIYSTNAFYVKRAEPWRYKGTDSLRGMKLGLVQDYSFGPKIDAYLKAQQNTANVNPLSGKGSIRRLISLLNLDRVDVVLEDENVFRYWLSKTAADMSVTNAGILSTEGAYIAFSPQHPKSAEYAKILQAGVEKMKINGRYEQIIKSYGIRY